MSSEEEYTKKMQELTTMQVKLQNEGLALSLASHSGNSGFMQPGIIKEQLSLGEELEVIDHLIQSHTLEYDSKQNKEVWKAPTDEDFIIFSDYGVHLFRQIISAYLNKNTLLSNYQPEIINTKMLDIATTINDEVLLSYEKIFYKPTIERCEKEITRDIDEKLKIKKMAMETLGLAYDEGMEKAKVIKEMEYQLEKRILNIRQKLFKDKLKKFSVILRLIQDIIHSTYNRAELGQERRSLRQHMQVTETTGGLNMPIPEKKGLLGRVGLK